METAPLYSTPVIFSPQTRVVRSWLLRLELNQAHSARHTNLVLQSYEIALLRSPRLTVWVDVALCVDILAAGTPRLPAVTS